MAKKTVFDNYRVEVVPDFHSLFRIDKTRKEKTAACKQLVEDIKRHIDNIESVNCKFDRMEICGFCGSAWEEWDDGRPLCCDAAIEEYESVVKKQEPMRDAPKEESDGKETR